MAVRLFSNENDDEYEYFMMIMEKKEYIAPKCEVIEMDLVNMIAGSTPEVGGDMEENESGDMMSNRKRGEWGNLWGEN